LKSILYERGRLIIPGILWHGVSLMNNNGKAIQEKIKKIIYEICNLFTGYGTKLHAKSIFHLIEVDSMGYGLGRAGKFVCRRRCRK
jgi:hypothetical protein